MLNPVSSPGDPLFFLHHTWLDRLWAKWQEEDPETRHAEIGGNNRANGFFGGGGGFPGGPPGNFPGFPGAPGDDADPEEPETPEGPGAGGPGGGFTPPFGGGGGAFAGLTRPDDVP